MFDQHVVFVATHGIEVTLLFLALAVEERFPVVPVGVEEARDVPLRHHVPALFLAQAAALLRLGCLPRGANALLRDPIIYER